MILLGINSKNYKVNLNKVTIKENNFTDLLLYKRDMKMSNDSIFLNMGSFRNLFFKGWGKEGLDKIFKVIWKGFCNNHA